MCGCVSTHVSSSLSQTDEPDQAIVEVTPNTSNITRPPFWPPHEHERFPGLIDQVRNVSLLESDHHWNHISVDSDPTANTNTQ